MNDWIARTYIKLPDGLQYRVKVFDQVVGVERQQPTHGDNLLYNHADAGTVWDGNAFDTRALAVLIKRYEAATQYGYGEAQLPLTSQDNQ